MPNFDLSEFKRLLTATRERDAEQAKLHRPTDITAAQAARRNNRRALEQLLGPALEKTGVAISKLNEILAQDQTGRRNQFQVEKAAAAKMALAQQKAFQDSIDQGQAALRHLRGLPADLVFGGLSNLITLPQPFLIWEWPLDQALVSTSIVPLRSRARIRLDVPIYSFDNDSGSRRNEFSFYFLWSNESDFLAVVNCFSVLGLNGACELYANSGVFSGDTASLSIDAYLYPVAFWMPLPPGGDIRSLRMQGDPLQHQNVLNNLTAEGGGLFGSADTKTQTFSARSYGVSFGSFGGVSIPARSTAIFEVNLTLSCSWQGNTLPDEIIADFADERMQYSVECPLVALQFLTKPPVMAA